MRRGLLLLWVLLGTSCGLTADRTPAGPASSSGWTRIEPGGGTACLHGTPYAFWARRGDPERLLVYFEGGGGCWSAGSCRRGSSFVRDRVVETDAPYHKAGIFDPARADNPFREHSAVFIPSCTGDVHWGDKTVDYPAADGAPAVRARHLGHVNASAALAWAYENVKAPESISVVGCSAGSVGARVQAPGIIEAYPQARVTVLGDSMTFVFPRPVALGRQVSFSKRLSPELMEAGGFVDGADIRVEQIDRAVTSVYPAVTFAFYTGHADPVQARFYQALGGTAAGFRRDFDAHLSAMRAAAPNFRTYVSSSATHCVLREDEFYTIREHSRSLRDWVSALSRHQSVESVACRGCDAD